MYSQASQLTLSLTDHLDSETLLLDCLACLARQLGHACMHTRNQAPPHQACISAYAPTPRATCTSSITCAPGLPQGNPESSVPSTRRELMITGAKATSEHSVCCGTPSTRTQHPGSKLASADGLGISCRWAASLPPGRNTHACLPMSSHAMGPARRVRISMHMHNIWPRPSNVGSSPVLLATTM